MIKVDDNFCFDIHVMLGKVTFLSSVKLGCSVSPVVDSEKAVTISKKANDSLW